MALSCDLASLTAASRCFNCLSATEKEALKVYFMAQTLKAAGGPDLTDLNVRNQASACLGCESDFMLDSMETAIWQNLAVNTGSIIPTSISELRKLIRCTFCGEQKTTRAAFISLLCQLVGFSSPAVETNEWAMRVVANGGPMPSQNTIEASSLFLVQISSLRSRIYHLNFIAPDSLIAMRTPLINFAGNDPWIPVTVGTGFAETLSVQGWRGYADAANGIVYNTGGVVKSTNTQGGLSVYCPEAAIANTSAIGIAGRIGSAGTELFQVKTYTTGTKKSEFYYLDAGSSVSVNNPCNPNGCGGFFSGNRTALGVSNLYHANSTHPWTAIGTSLVNNVQFPGVVPIAVGGTQSSGVYSVCPQMVSFYADHAGFSSAEGQLLFNAVQALRVALGGGFL